MSALTENTSKAFVQKTRADFKAAEARAATVLREFGIERPPVDPVEIAQQLDIRVAFVEFDTEYSAVSGFYDVGEQAIYVNKADPPFRQTFTVAHELGHHLMHRDWAQSTEYRVLLRDTTDHANPYEQEANAFAAHLLVPREMLDRYKKIATVSELSKLFLVSIPVIRNRMNRERWSIIN